MAEKEPDLSALARRIEEAKGAPEPPPLPPSQSPGMGMRVGVELVSGTAVGGFIGYKIDTWLGTMPLFFLICLIFGIAAGGLALYKLARQTSNDV